MKGVPFNGEEGADCRLIPITKPQERGEDLWSYAQTIIIDTFCFSQNVLMLGDCPMPLQRRRGATDLDNVRQLTFISLLQTTRAKER